MKNNEANVAQLNPQPEVPTQENAPFNPFLFQYDEGVNVSVPGDLFLALLDLTGVVAQNETKEQVIIGQFDPQQDIQTQMSQFRKSVLITTTPIGEQASNLIESLIGIHRENANSGLAKMVNPGGLIQTGVDEQ